MTRQSLISQMIIARASPGRYCRSMLTYVAVGIALGLALGAIALGVRVHLRIRTLLERPQTAAVPPYDDTELRDAIAALGDALASQDDRVGKLLIAVDEGIQHVDRSERRVRAVVQRAKSRLADLGYEDEGVEAEHRALSLVHAGDGGEESMPPVQQSVADPGDRFAAFPGDWYGTDLAVGG